MVITAPLKNILFLSVLSCAVFLWSADPASAGGPVIRETRDIVIDGTKERWRLEWSSPRREVCGPKDPDWMICPCMGFAFGEAGKLVLVRELPGTKEDRFPLGPLFKEYDAPGRAGEAVVRRWDVQDSDLEKSDLPGFAAKVRKRPKSAIMNFGDYDHDGRASEFLLQVGTLPCGKRMSVVIGVSGKNGSIHVFTSAARPDRPLVLQAWQWEKLRRAKEAIRVVSWPCGDHGSDRETELELRAEEGTILTIRREFECTANDKRGKMIKEEPF